MTDEAPREPARPIEFAETLDDAISLAENDDDKVSILFELMTTGRYGGMQTLRLLGKRWRHNIGTMNRFAAEARRWMRNGVSPDETKERAAMALGYLDRVKAMALTGEKKNLSAGLAAIKLEGLICGFITVKHEVQHKQKDQFESWSEQELLRYAETGERPDQTGGDDDDATRLLG